MKKVHILFFVVAILVLPVSFGTAYAAQLCDEVKVRIKGKDAQDALKRISTHLRLHGKELEKSGNKYEGQMDIACLVGLYMTTGLESDEDVLDRYIGLEEMMRNQFGQNDQMMMRAVWEYKDMDFVTDSMRREHWAESEFFLLALANMPKEIVTANRAEGFPYNTIQDYAFCRGAARDREKLDLHRNVIEEISATGKDWSVLSENQFVENKKTWIETPELVEICDPSQIITSRTVKDVKDTYRKKANDLTRTYWEGFLEDGSTPERGWKSLEWLEPSCPWEPSNNEKEIIKSAKEMAKDLDSSKWWQQDQQERYLESFNLAKNVLAVGEPSCQKSIGARLTGIRHAIDKGRDNFERAIRNDITKYWDGLANDSEDKRLKDRLTNSRPFVAQITQQPEMCVLPDEDVEGLIAAGRVFRSSTKLSDDVINAFSETLPSRLRILKEFEEKCQGEKPALVMRELRETIEASRSEWGRIFRKQTAQHWVEFYDTGKFDPNWSDLNRIKFCVGCIPNSEDEDLIAAIRDKTLLVERSEIQELRTRIKSLNFPSGGISEILKAITKYLGLWDQSVERYWGELLQSCEIPLSSDEGLVYVSQNQSCSVPSPNESQHLRNYCRLQLLSKQIPPKLQRSQTEDLNKDDCSNKRQGDICVKQNFKGELRSGVCALDNANANANKDEKELICNVNPTIPVEDEPIKVSNETAEGDKDLVLIDVFRLDKASTQVNDVGFINRSEYRGAFRSLQRGRLEEIVIRRAADCQPSINSITNAKIGSLRTAYQNLFNYLGDVLEDRDVESDSKLKQRISEIEFILDEPAPTDAALEPEETSPEKGLSTEKISIRSNVPDADVYIDDDIQGSTPIELELSPGKYTLIVVKEGYKQHRQELVLKKGESPPILIKLNLEEQATESIPAPESSDQATQGQCQVVTFNEATIVVGSATGRKLAPSSKILDENMGKAVPELIEMGMNAKGTYAELCLRGRNCQQYGAGDSIGEYVILWISLEHRTVILMNSNIYSTYPQANDFPVDFHTAEHQFEGSRIVQQCEVR